VTEPGDTVAVWGFGPVAPFVIKSGWMLGAGRIIAIDRIAERLEMARVHGNAKTINFDERPVDEQLMEMTRGRGPDRCIDAVGCEAHTSSTLVATWRLPWRRRSDAARSVHEGLNDEDGPNAHA
jgi:threonine dehydrogenase-like Zn-dependent dehydrogenase